MQKIFMTLVIIIPMILCASSWTNNTNKDKMTGETTFFAMSPTIQAENKMDFPYSSTKSNLIIGCKNGNQFAYFWFSNSPNLNDAQTEDGYNEIQTRIKIGKNIKTIGFVQDWGGKSLSVSDYSSPIKTNEFVEIIKKTNSVLLELDWHGNGTTYFQYPLRGSSHAIMNMQNNCGYTKILQGRLKKQAEIEKQTKQQLLNEKIKQKKLKDKVREVKQAINKADTWVEKKEAICNFEKYTARKDIIPTINGNMPSKLSDCKIYSSTSTVCKYDGKNVLGNNKMDIENKYKLNQICSPDNQSDCLSFNFNINNKLLRINGCYGKPIGAEKTKKEKEEEEKKRIEQKKKRCIKEEGYWSYGKNHEIICGWL